MGAGVGSRGAVDVAGVAVALDLGGVGVQEGEGGAATGEDLV